MIAAFTFSMAAAFTSSMAAAFTSSMAAIAILTFPLQFCSPSLIKDTLFYDSEIYWIG
jgi:hypothetical protein